MTDHEAIRESTRYWLENTVIALNLCPFARREVVADRVRFRVTDSESEQALLNDLQHELQKLEENADIETTLLIHPGLLQDFCDYNDFLAVADGLLVDLGLESVYQIASFHPGYQFAETEANDAENYTNRSPWPMLHLLREASLTRAIDAYPDTDDIPQRNIEQMKAQGGARMRALLHDCYRAGS